MYTEYYGLTGHPFRLTPDERFYYNSEVHRRAMAYLRYGLEQAEGFIVITGDIGTGKTMLIRNLFSEIQDDEIMAAQLVTTKVLPDDMLRMVCASFGLAHEGMNKATMLHNLEVICRASYAQGKRILLVVDEAHNLPPGSLEELRLLANYQSGGRALFQSFLLGQNQLRRTLKMPDMAQLQQRIIASYHLDPLSEEESRSYIEHRLQLVGWKNDPVLDDEAFIGIFEATGGVPRLINTLCDRLLLFGCIEEKRGLGRTELNAVLEDMERGADGEAARPEEDGGLSSSAPSFSQDQVRGQDTPGASEGHLFAGDSGIEPAVTVTKGNSEKGPADLSQRVTALEGEVARLGRVVRQERALLRKAILLQLDLDPGEEID